MIQGTKGSAMMLKTRFVLIAWLGVLLAGATAASEGGFRRVVEWTNPATGAAAQGLYQFATDLRTVSRTRLLAAPPEGELVIIDQVREASSGTQTTTLQGAVSDWWLELAEELAAPSADLQSLSKAIVDVAEAQEGEPVREIAIRTSSGLRFSGRFRIRENLPVRYGDVIEELIREGLHSAVAEGMPPELQSSIYFLDASLGMPIEGDLQAYARNLAGAELRSVAEILALILEAAGVPRKSENQAKSWRPLVGAVLSGPDPTDDEGAAFVARFTVSPLIVLEPE